MLAAGPLSATAQDASDALAESLSRTSIRAPAISPDAHSVVYLQRETNWKENEFVWQLWRVNAAGGEAVQLTRGKKSAGAAQWSPDGRWLAFLTEREAYGVEPYAAVQKDAAAKRADKGEAADAAKPAAKQIWLISPDGGEAWPLTKSETNVEDFHWAKDGRSILFTAAEHPSKASKARKERYSAYEVIDGKAGNHPRRCSRFDQAFRRRSASAGLGRQRTVLRCRAKNDGAAVSPGCRDISSATAVNG